MKITLFLSIVLSCLVLSLKAQKISIDSTYGEDGHLFLPDNFDLIATSNNKLIGVKLEKFHFRHFGFTLGRFDENGVADTSFGIDGVSELILMDDWDINFSLIEFKSNEAFQIVGRMKKRVVNNPAIKYFICQFNKDGIIDENFGDKGYIFTAEIPKNFTTGSIFLQEEGKLLAVGRIKDEVDKIDFCILRFNQVGQLDTTFRENGIAIENLNADVEDARAVKLQSDGKILVFGHSWRSNTDNDFALIRLESNGKLDDSFGEKGKVFVDFNRNIENAISLAIQPDEKIILLGESNHIFNRDFALARLNPDGSLDESFGIGGKVITDFYIDENVLNQSKDRIYSLLLQENKNFFVVGSTTYPGTNEDCQAIAYYNENGFLNHSFGQAGKMIIHLEEKNSRATTIMDKPNGILISSLCEIDFNEELYEYVITKFISDLNVGIFDFSIQKNSTLVYPNPILAEATLEYILETSETLTIQLTDLNGRILKTYLQNQYQKAGDYQQAIDLPSNLPKGFYCLRLTSTNGQLVVKVVK